MKNESRHSSKPMRYRGSNLKTKIAMGCLLSISLVGLYWGKTRATSETLHNPAPTEQKVSHLEVNQTTSVDPRSSEAEKNHEQFSKASTFKAFSKPAVQELMEDAELGEVVVITMENGGKVYRFNDEVYDVSNDTFSKKQFSN